MSNNFTQGEKESNQKEKKEEQSFADKYNPVLSLIRQILWQIKSPNQQLRLFPKTGMINYP